VYRPSSGEQLIGKPVVRLWLEAELSGHPHDVLVGAPAITPGRILWERDHSDDYARSLGVVPVREQVEALLEGSRIRALIVTRSLESEARFQAAERTLTVIHEFEAAQNAGAVDRAVHLFAEDAVGVTADGTRWVGKDQIRTAIEHGWASGAHIERARYQVSGDRVTSQASISSDLLRGIGIGALQVTAEATVRDGLIRSTTSTLSPESAARLQAAQNRAVANRFVEAFNAHDLDALDGLLAAEVVNRTGSTEGQRGASWVREHFAALFAASTDLNITLDELITERDLIVLRMSTRGTQTGVWQGIEPAGQSISTRGVEIWRVQRGQIVELWAYSQ
jgi:predicted ester cyclase